MSEKQCPEQFEIARKEAQELADLYHAPYFVTRGRINFWTVSSAKGVVRVLPLDGKVLPDIVIGHLEEA